MLKGDILWRVCYISNSSVCNRLFFFSQHLPTVHCTHLVQTTFLEAHFREEIFEKLSEFLSIINLKSFFFQFGFRFLFKVFD